MPEQAEKYRVLKRLQHDGATFKPGDQIELQEVNATYLRRQRMIGKIETAAKRSGKGGEV